MSDGSRQLGPILWSTYGTKGLLIKKVVWKAGITNQFFYTVKYDDNGENPTTDAVSVKDLDAVVINSYRQGSVGMSCGMGMGIRTYMPRTSNTVGAVKFFTTYGETVATLTVDDPHGLVSLFKTAKKNAVREYGPKCKGSPTCMNPTTNGWCKFHAAEKARKEKERDTEKNMTHIGTELSKLAKLLERGELTKEEYEEAKKKLLGLS